MAKKSTKAPAKAATKSLEKALADADTAVGAASTAATNVRRAGTTKPDKAPGDITQPERRPTLAHARKVQQEAIDARFKEADAKGDPSLTKADHEAADFQAARVSGGGF